MRLKGSGRIVQVLASGLPEGRGGIVTTEVLENHLAVPPRYCGTENKVMQDGMDACDTITKECQLIMA